MEAFPSFYKLTFARVYYVWLTVCCMLCPFTISSLGAAGRIPIPFSDFEKKNVQSQGAGNLVQVSVEI